MIKNFPFSHENKKMEKEKCSALTKAKKPCSRNAKINGMCNQHSKMVNDGVEGPKEKIPPVITITFGDVAENHARMQKIGTLAEEGFSVQDLEEADRVFSEKGYQTELVDLNAALPEDEEEQPEQACVLIVRNGVQALLDGTEYTINDLMAEHTGLTWDTKALMRGRVVNKHARYNLCYSDQAQDADYEAGKGTIIAWDSIPLLKHIRTKLPEFAGLRAEGLNAEGNLYYDPSQCGIGFHGDAERKKVIALRLGGSIPLHYQWFRWSKPVGERIKLNLDHGDLYIMSAKAVGFDWMKKKTLTLRHAAGAEKFLTIDK